MNKPRCKTCNYTEISTREGSEARRAQCWCTHPDAEKAFEASGQRSAPCFIGFTPVNGYFPTIKTCPKWCPLLRKESETDENA